MPRGPPLDRHSPRHPPPSRPAQPLFRASFYRRGGQIGGEGGVCRFQPLEGAGGRPSWAEAEREVERLFRARPKIGTARRHDDALGLASRDSCDDQTCCDWSRDRTGATAATERRPAAPGRDRGGFRAGGPPRPPGPRRPPLPAPVRARVRAPERTAEPGRLRRGAACGAPRPEKSENTSRSPRRTRTGA